MVRTLFLPVALLFAAGPITLRLKEPVSSDLKLNQVAHFEVAMEAGQFASVTTKADDGLLTLEIAGPGGSVPGAVAGNSALWIAGATGVYQVNASAPNGPVHFEIELTDLRAHLETDTARVQVQAKLHSAILSHQDGDHSSALKLYKEAAIASRRLGDEQKALDIYRRALTMVVAGRNSSEEARLLVDIASVYVVLGEQQKVLDTYHHVLAIQRGAGDTPGIILALTNLGNLYRDMGAEDTALDYYRQAVDAGRASAKPSSIADALMGMGDVYFFLGEKRKSIDAYEQSIALKRTEGDRSGEALGLIGLANVYSDLASRQKPEDSEGLAGKQKGIEYFEKSLGMGRASGDYVVQVFALMGGGVTYSALGDKEKAIAYLNQALFIFNFARFRQGIGWARYEMARVERDRGNLAKAQAYVAEARGIIESLRATVVSQDLRASFFAAVRDCYSLEIDILMRLHAADPAGPHLAAALSASERARARVLLESLGESRAEIRQGVDPALLARERALQLELNAKEMARLRLLAGSGTAQLNREMEKAVSDVTAQYEALGTRIREQSPHYAALKFPQPLSVADIQKQVLDPDTLLVEFALGEEQSFRWIVSQDSIQFATLPSRREIEAAARVFHDSLSAQNSDGLKSGETLSRLLLSDGTALGTKRLLVVADGALQYVPFGALTDPGTSQPLIVQHEVVSLPSASALAVLRNETRNRKPAPKALAIFADPVFSADDSRIAARPLQRSSQAAAPLRLPRLPGTRREAAAIATLAPENARKQALDFDASRDALTSPEIAQYRILHLATHGLLNTEHPELSGIALSLVDRQGKPQDGFIRLHEIYNLRLSTDLVVLSACRTALGKEIQGEGLVGLTRGFMYAGAPRVVASLWKVDDRATAELMKRFYQAMLGPGRLPAAAALRAAQVEMSRSKGWENPYYWAAFTLQGEWR